MVVVAVMTLGQKYHEIDEIGGQGILLPLQLQRTRVSRAGISSFDAGGGGGDGDEDEECLWHLPSSS